MKERQSQPHHAGRWPANVVHDGSDEVVDLFPASRSYCTNEETAENASGKVFENKDRRIYAMRSNNGSDFVRGKMYSDTGSAARFFYCAKASRKERDAGLEDLPKQKAGCMDGNSGRSGECVAGDGVSPVKQVYARNHHPTVKPIALMRWLARLVTPTNGLVLDPYCGSGTTGIAAKLEHFDFIGVDNKEEYIEIAQRRIDYWEPEAQMDLLEGVGDV